MDSVWSLVYTIAFGLVGAYYAKKVRKNPYLWFFLASLFKIYTPILILALMLVKLFIKRLVFKKMQSTVRATTPPSPNPFPKPSEGIPLFWYYLTEDKETKGPVSSLGLKQLQKEGAIAENTLVWNETFENWTPFKQAVLFEDTQFT